MTMPPLPGCAGSVEVSPELAQELLEASDQYMLETLKRLCEMKIREELEPDNVSAVGARGRSCARGPHTERSGLWELPGALRVTGRGTAGLPVCYPF